MSPEAEQKLAGSNVQISVRESLADIEAWFAPWYCDKLGATVQHDNADARMIRLGEAWSIPNIVDKFHLSAVAESLTGQRKPITIIAPTLTFQGKITLVLDGNHRLAAARMLEPVPQLLVLELAADGALLDQKDLPDLRHMTDMQRSL